jgi:hypothetical protein
MCTSKGMQKSLGCALYVRCALSVRKYGKWCTSALVYADDVNILGGSMHTIKKSAEALVVASEEVEVNAERTMHMVMSRDQEA